MIAFWMVRSDLRDPQSLLNLPVWGRLLRSRMPKKPVLQWSCFILLRVIIFVNWLFYKIRIDSNSLWSASTAGWYRTPGWVGFAWPNGRYVFWLVFFLIIIFVNWLFCKIRIDSNSLWSASPAGWYRPPGWVSFAWPNGPYVFSILFLFVISYLNSWNLLNN